MMATLNASCDAVLAVSDATGRVAVPYGLDPAVLETSYIGTTHADLFDTTAPKPLPDGPLTLGYLGYMRRDKGFYFLLDALEALPDDLAAQIHLVVAARRGPPAVMARLGALGARLAGLTHHDGYSHDTLDTILDPVDVGLIPVMWHDNLPQVAIEMHARHIPLLCSDLGGAQELSAAPQMTFAAGDTAAFTERLQALRAGQVDLAAYWARAMAPVSLAAHRAQLTSIYGRSRAATKGALAQGTETSGA